MKIAWFTPFSANSAIGRSGRYVAECLASRADVEIFCFDKDETHSTAVPVRKFASHRDVTEQTLAGYDFAVYNFGNYLPYHGDLFEVSRRVPGVCVLHDYVLHHFFAGYYLEKSRDQAGYVAVMTRLYGDAGRAAAERSVSSRGPRVWETDEVVDFPMFEPAIAGARGVVTHSRFFRDRVEQAWAVPVIHLPLPYRIEGDPGRLTRQQLGIPEGKTLVVTIGHVNPNKRVDATIEALGRIRTSAPAFQLVIAGPCPDTYRQELETHARRVGIDSNVTFAGRVSDDALHSILELADICVNLRYPVIEGASASAIEEMLYGKPVIVSDIGFYAELPADAVRRIDPHSVDQLADALRGLIGNRAEREATGARAREFAGSEFRGESYAARFLEFTREIRQASPVLGVADRIGIECARMGITPEMTIVETLAERLDELWGDSTRP
ncbi:MAG: glycosyltransferase family 4 protein [Bryobacteraceae bacterium]